MASWWQNLVNVAQGEAESYRFLTDFTVFIALLLFSPSITALFFVHSFWCYFIKQRWGSLNQPSANVFVLRDFNVHGVWWTYSCVTGRPGEFYYNCSISSDFIQNINFHTWIPGFDSYGLALLNLLLSSDPSLCCAIVFPPWGNFGHFVSVSIEFRPNSKEDARCHCIAYDYSCADWNYLHDDSNHVSLEVVSVAAFELSNWILFEIEFKSHLCVIQLVVLLS